LNSQDRNYIDGKFNHPSSTGAYPRRPLSYQIEDMSWLYSVMKQNVCHVIDVQRHIYIRSK